MDDLLSLLRKATLSQQLVELPRQIRTRENQQNRTEPLRDTLSGLTRTAVCGKCLMKELIEPQSECELILIC